MKIIDAVQAMGALAHESRLASYRLLVKRGPAGFNPGELSERLNIPASTLSFHLKELQRVDLVVARRQGRFLYYSANFERMRVLVDFLTENCCSLSDTACDSECKPLPRSKRA
jgi:DNA-binding transcriptional ArsR family regulator